MYNFTWPWLLSQGFITSPDNVRRQKITCWRAAQTLIEAIWGLDRTDEQATTWLSCSDLSLKNTSLSASSPGWNLTDRRFIFINYILLTTAGKEAKSPPPNPPDLSLMFQWKQLNHSQSGLREWNVIIDESLGFYGHIDFTVNSIKCFTDSLGVQ